MSEFGKGLAYCLGLFLAHAERHGGLGQESEINATVWFNGAADHLVEMDTDNAPKKLEKRLIKFKDKCLDFRQGLSNTPTAADFYWAVLEAKELLRLLDKEAGIKTEKAKFL